MAAPRKYPDEPRERAIRKAVDLRRDPATRTGALRRVGEHLGINPETLRNWVHQAEIDEGHRPSVTTAEAQRGSPSWSGRTGRSRRCRPAGTSHTARTGRGAGMESGDAGRSLQRASTVTATSRCGIHRLNPINFEAGSSCALNRHGIVGSMGRVGAAGDTTAMESYFSLLLKDVLNRRS